MYSRTTVADSRGHTMIVLSTVDVLLLYVVHRRHANIREPKEIKLAACYKQTHLCEGLQCMLTVIDEHKTRM